MSLALHCKARYAMLRQEDTSNKSTQIAGFTWRLSGKLLAAIRLRFSRLMSLARTAGEAG